ncbi:MAG: prepilin-type N-terminal cleavage/methylation domain-containing protein [Candidatus Azotimanducaceae bacterium]|jgi:prepilin-type N-terminal cleavage/methylation domain-containing protein
MLRVPKRLSKLSFKKIVTIARGFTILELLIAIAIIGVLSIIIYASLGTTRLKADNAYNISQAREYVRVLELLFLETDSHPDYATSITEDICFSGTGTCGWFGGAYTGGVDDTNVTTMIRQYMSSLPTLKPIKLTLAGGSGTVEAIGPAYRCKERAGGRCVKAHLDWYLNFDHQQCGFGASEVPSPENNVVSGTWCRLEIGTSPAMATCPLGQTDNDGDGMCSGPDDCNDSNPEIFSGHPEIFGDGLDNDCDGIVL